MEVKFNIGNREALIDADIEVYVNLFKWRVSIEGSNTYAKASLPRFLDRKTDIRLHHLITYWVDGNRRMPGRVIDHINGNGLDNRRCNLRMATCSENLRNQKKAKGRHSYKGVYKIQLKDRIRWGAQLKIPGAKTLWIGSFDTIEDAAKAYDLSALMHHGAFARLNFDTTTGEVQGSK